MARRVRNLERQTVSFRKPMVARYIMKECSISDSLCDCCLTGNYCTGLIWLFWCLKQVMECARVRHVDSMVKTLLKACAVRAASLCRHT